MVQSGFIIFRVTYLLIFMVCFIPVFAMWLTFSIVNKWLCTNQNYYLLIIYYRNSNGLINGNQSCSAVVLHVIKEIIITVYTGSNTQIFTVLQFSIWAKWNW